jgi:hypothetical protein
MQQADSEDRQNPSRQGQRSNFVDTNKNDIHEVRPAGTSAKAALRRLRKDQLNQRPVGTNQYSEGLYTNKNDVQVLSAPTGTSTKAALRRLRKEDVRKDPSAPNHDDRLLVTPDVRLCRSGGLDPRAGDFSLKHS